MIRVALIGGIVALTLLTTAAVMWVNAERRAAVEAERRARIADAIELIRDADKRLGVKRKATNADLCRGMGGQPGECQ